MNKRILLGSVLFLFANAYSQDEALHHLYYRQSMKGPSKIELNKALGKLLNTLSALKEKDPDHKKIPEVTHYVIQIYKKLNNKSKQIELQEELLFSAPDSKWAKFYKLRIKLFIFINIYFCNFVLKFYFLQHN